MTSFCRLPIYMNTHPHVSALGLVVAFRAPSYSSEVRRQATDGQILNPKPYRTLKGTLYP